MSIFVKSTDTFVVPVAVAFGPNNLAAVAETKEAVEKSIKDSGQEGFSDVEEHQVTFRYPNFKDSTQIVDNSLEMVEGQLTFRSVTLRLNRLIALTKDWTFKDESGSQVDINAETVGELHPMIASYLGGKMEEIVGML